MFSRDVNSFMKISELLNEASITDDKKVEVWVNSNVRSWFGDKTFTVKDGEVYSDNGCEFSCQKSELPVQFAEISTFNLRQGKLTTLKGCPRKVEKRFSVVKNPITSLEGCPESVRWVFEIRETEITSLDHITPVMGSCLISQNKLTSLKDIHKKIRFTKGVGSGILSAGNNPVKSHILGVILIEGIQELMWNAPGVTPRYNDSESDYKKAFDIVRRHVGKGKAGVLAAQDELIDAGLDDFAQL